MRYRGFTLIELLVVMAIMAILLAMINPTISVSNALARRMMCQSNLHRIGVSARMYVEDYDLYPASLEKLNREIIRDRSALACTRTDKPYYFERHALGDKLESFLAACVRPRDRARWPHDGGDTDVAVRLNGVVVVLRR